MQRNQSIKSWQDLSHSDREQIAEDLFEDEDYHVKVFRFKYQGAFYQTLHGVELIVATHQRYHKPLKAMQLITKLREEVEVWKARARIAEDELQAARIDHREAMADRQLLLKQIEHERYERQAAQRTISRLGGDFETGPDKYRIDWACNDVYEYRPHSDAYFFIGDIRGYGITHADSNAQAIAKIELKKQGVL